MPQVLVEKSVFSCTTMVVWLPLAVPSWVTKKVKTAFGISESISSLDRLLLAIERALWGQAGRGDDGELMQGHILAG